MNLNGAVALVTGGGRRVGRAIALSLGRAGCQVVVHYRHSMGDAEAVVGEIMAGGGRAAVVGGDLNDPADWPVIVGQAAGRFGRLDILVNNASAFLTEIPDDVEHFRREQWEFMLRVNTIAPVALCHYARPRLGAHGAGKIINLSDAAVERPQPTHLAYAASKAALCAVTRALARAFAPVVQVNAIAPGIAAFPDSYPAELRQRLVSQVPLGREGSPDDVARLVRFLCEEGDYITGQVIPIDGGRNTV